MQWDLVEIHDPPYSALFSIVSGLQVLLLAFSFFYFLFNLVEYLVLKNKFCSLEVKLKNNEFQKHSELLLGFKAKYRLNFFINPIVDFYLCNQEFGDIEKRKFQFEELHSNFEKRICKNNYKLKFMMLFSITSVLYAIYEFWPIVGLGKNYVFGFSFLSLLTIVLLVSTIYLKRFFIKLLIEKSVALQMVLANHSKKI